MKATVSFITASGSNVNMQMMTSVHRKSERSLLPSGGSSVHGYWRVSSHWHAGASGSYAEGLARHSALVQSSSQPMGGFESCRHTAFAQNSHSSEMPNTSARIGRLMTAEYGPNAELVT